MKIKNLAKNWRHILFLSVLIQLGEFTQAQILTPNYPTPAEAVTRGYDQSLLTVQIGFTSACTDDTVTIQLPPSVNYVVGSVTKTAGAASFAIADADLSDLRTPSFEITGVTGAGSITFTIAREAACGTGVSGKDTVLVKGSCGTASESVGNVNTYNILAPSFSLTAPPTLTGAIIGRSATRTITLTNGGNGDADTLFFYLVYEAGGVENTDALNQVTANGVLFAPFFANGDTLFYKIFGTTLFGGDDLITNGESVTITEPIQVLKCNANTLYAAGWGTSNIEICQWAQGTSSVTMVGGVPIPSAYTYTRDPGYLDMCTSPHYWDITFSNNGTGNDTAAGMYNVDFQLNGFSGFQTISNGRVNGNTITKFTYIGGVLRMDLDSAFTSDPDGAGVGFEDLDGDGFFDDLPRGSTIVLRVDVTINCNQNCGDKDNYARNRVVRYENMCGVSVTTTSTRNDGIARLTYRSFNGTAKLPANILGGVPFRMTLGVAHNGANSTDLNTGNQRYQYKLVLPPGYSVSGTGNPTYGGAPITYTQVADTIFVTSPSTSIRDVEIDLVLNCAGLGSGSVTFNYEFIWINNIVTGCRCLGRIKCTSVNSYQHCPTPCASGGPRTYLPNIRRADGSLGWVNSSLTTRQTVANISTYDLAKALYLDTLEVTTSALQTSVANNIHLDMSVIRASAALSPLLALEIQVQVIRAGAQVSSCTLTSADDSSSAAGTQIMDWDLTSCLPAGGLLANDSIYTFARYVVNHNQGLPQQDIQTGVSTRFYNADPVLGKVGCNFFIPEMYLVGTNAIDGRNAFRTTGCSVGNLGGSGSNIARRFNTGGEIYANEFRPVFYVDSVIVESTPYHDVVETQILGPARTPDAIDGKTYTYRNPGTWPVVGLTKTNSYGGSIRYLIQPNCKTPASSNHRAYIYIKDYYYALANRPSYPSKFVYVLGDGGSLDTINDLNAKNSTVTHTAGSNPILFTQNLTGDVVAASSQESWDVNIQNNGINTAGYHWISLNIPSGSGVTIDSVQNLSTAATLTPMSYSSGNTWYQNTIPGIPSSGSDNFRIFFKYSNCSPDSIKLRTGWNCAAYPNPSPLDTNACASDSIWLKVIPSVSQIQLSVLRQPGAGTPHNLCASDSIILRVNSAQNANVLSPKIEISVPTGVSVVSPVRVEYPNGSGIYQTIIPTVIAGGVSLDISDHPGVTSADGMPGLIENPAAPGRQARVIIPYETDCDHISGTGFGLTVFGERPCGSPADGNDEDFNTNGIDITGAASPGGLGVTMNIPNDTFRCGVAQTLTLSTTPVIAGTQVGDTVFYILPEGTVYEGNFVSGSNCGTCTASSEPGSAPNTTVVKVALQPGVASGLVIDYSFDVGVGNTGSCGDTRIEAEVRREIAPLTCSTLPPPSLCGRSTVIAGKGSKDVVVARAELSIPTYDAANNYPYGSPYQYIYWGTISNSALVASGNTITINTYFDRNQNGQYDRLLDTFIQSTIVNGPIGAGQSISFADTFVSTTQPPSPSRPLFSVIDTADGNCLCAGFAPSPFLNALPVDWLSISAENDDNQIGLIKWSTAAEYNTLMFEVYRSIDGVTFQKVGEEKAKGTTQTISRYMFPDDIANLGNGKVYYKLKQIDNNGDYSWSQVVDLTKENKSSPITVVPNPANGQIKLSLNSAQSGSYVAEVLDVTGKLIYSWNVVVTELSNSVNLDVTVLPIGVYTLRVNNQSIKLLIKR